jgi:thymidylate synthase (FAD)
MSDTKVWKAEDGIGSIEILEVFGNDLTVVNAARVSFAKESESMSERDEKLITYLAKHDHISPFFHPQIRVRIKMPLFVAREWFRHTIGFARNEVSRRYVDSEPELWFPAPSNLRERDPKLKQGSKDTSVEDSVTISDAIRDAGVASIHLYTSLLAKQVAPEIARSVLPQSMYTEYIETGSLAAYARLWKLRTDPTAQREIQIYASALGFLLSPYFPISWDVLTKCD